jgi:hypothetical protein
VLAGREQHDADQHHRAKQLGATDGGRHGLGMDRVHGEEKGRDERRTGR